MPYALTDIKKKAANALQTDVHAVDETHISEEDEEIREITNDLAKDRMIKPKGPKGKSKGITKSTATTTSRSKQGTKPKQKLPDAYDEGDGFVVSDDDSST